MFKVGDNIECVMDYAGGGCLVKGQLYTVAVVVERGKDWTGDTEGVIVTHAGSYGRDSVFYPYVWDTARFRGV